jgi:hypothetical protein
MLKSPEEVQAELKAYKPTNPAKMSEELRARFIAETDPDRLTDEMRNGANDSGLWVAWLRS